MAGTNIKISEILRLVPATLVLPVFVETKPDPFDFSTGAAGSFSHNSFQEYESDKEVESFNNVLSTDSYTLYEDGSFAATFMSWAA